MKTQSRRNKGCMVEKGTTYIEMMIVVAIIAIGAGIGGIWLGRMRDGNTVGTGIQRVYMLKKSMEQMARECKGWPDRGSSLATDWSSMKNMLNRYGANNYPVGSGAPISVPTYHGNESGSCDSVSLQNLIPSGLFISTCEASDPDCNSMKSQKRDFNEVFVKDTAGDRCPEPGGGTTMLGWNYVLLTDNTLQNINTPVPMYCANVTYKDSSVTVVVNGGGIYKNQVVPDGSGTYDYSGAKLPSSCACGAWCKNNKTGEQGCCMDCVDGGAQVTGIGFRY